MSERTATLPAQLRRSITWAQGKEMAEHVRFTVDSGVQTLLTQLQTSRRCAGCHRLTRSPSSCVGRLRTHRLWVHY